MRFEEQNRIIETLENMGYSDIIIYPDGLVDATLDGLRYLEMTVKFNPLRINKPKSVVRWRD